MKLSIIIPCYNEGDKLGNSLKVVKSYLNKKNISCELIVVDDGSTDKTRDVAKLFKEIKLNKKRKNFGKGYSVKEGISLAQGDFILFMDADLSTPIEELDKFLELIKKHDVIIASRAMKESEVESARYKILLGRISNLLISLLAVKGIKDTQCGFKLFKKKVATKIFGQQIIKGFGFDFEVLFLAQKQGFSIKEVPVKWTNRKGSKVKFVHYLLTLIELLRLKWYYITNKYKF